MKDIPEVVSAYFDADQANDVDALNQIFLTLPLLKTMAVYTEELWKFVHGC